MEKPIKGGYILISLGSIPLSTSYSGSIEYDKISKTKKHIILTGIKIATTVMPDIAVKPIYGNGTITFEDVYGFDVVVSSNNSVSVSEHTVSGGGTKLYKHSLILGTGTSNSAVVISTSGTPFIGTDEISKSGESGTFLATSIVVYDADNIRYIDCYKLLLSTGTYMGDGISENLIDYSFVSDTVTEL